MSVINLKCSSDKKEDVKKICLDILCEHYLRTVHPNTCAEYKNEGEEVYEKRMKELMKTELCKALDIEDGIQIEFDSTEDAGFSIADYVYGTGMGYSDQGLTFLKHIFDDLMEKMPDVCFEAECECSDKWVYEEYTCSYDGENFKCDAEWMEFDEEWDKCN